MRTFAVALAAILCASSLQHAVAADGGAWQSIFELDCAGQVHLLSNSPLATNINIAAARMMIDGYVREIKARAECACPNIQEDEVLRRFVPPSVDFLLGAWDGSVNQKASACAPTGTEASIKFQEGWFSNFVFGRGDRTKLNGQFLPSTCSYDSYRQGNMCAMKMVESVTNTELQFAAKKCTKPDGSLDSFPFLSVTCKGPFCEKVFMPCTANSECGSQFECKEVIDSTTWGELMVNASLVDTLSEIASCMDNTGASGFMNRIVTKIASYFPGAASVFTSGGLSVCLPTEATTDAIGNPFEDQLNATDVGYTDAAIKACVAHKCRIYDVGNGECDMECHNADCMWDGGDCKMVELKCPGLSTSAVYECSGHGSCDEGDDSNPPQCHCHDGWQNENNQTNGQTKCNKCYRSDGCQSGPLSEYDNGAKILTVKNVANKGFVAWDGILADQVTQTTSPDRMSGFAFDSVPAVMTSAAGNELFGFMGDRGMGFNYFNRHLGGSMLITHLQDWFNFLAGQGKTLLECRATNAGMDTLDDDQFAVRYIPYQPGYPLYQFTTHDTFELGNDMKDLLVMREGDTDWQKFKLKYPDTADFATWLKDKGMGFSYTYLGSLFGNTANINMQNKQSTEYPFGFYNMGAGGEGPIFDIIRSPKPCKTQNDCTTGSKCYDFAGPNYLNLNEALKGAEADPVGKILWGDNNFDRTCATSTRFRQTLRDFLLTIGDRPLDQGTELSFCFFDIDGIKDRAENWAKNLVSADCLDDASGSGAGTRVLSEETTTELLGRARELSQLGEVLDWVAESSAPVAQHVHAAVAASPFNELFTTMRSASVEAKRVHHLRRLGNCVANPVTVNGLNDLPSGADYLPAPAAAAGSTGDGPVYTDEENEYVLAEATLPGVAAAQFDAFKQSSFKTAIAKTLTTDDVPLTEADVIITDYKDVPARRRELAGSGSGSGASTKLHVSYAIKVKKGETTAITAKIQDTTTFNSALGQELAQSGVIPPSEANNVSGQFNGVSTEAPNATSAVRVGLASVLSTLIAAFAVWMGQRQ